MSIHDSLKAAVIPFYRDEYLVEQDQLGDTGAQDWLMRYLKDVLPYMYRHEQWMVATRRDHHHEAIDNSQKLIVPDIAVFKGIYIPLEEQLSIPRWDMRKGDRKAPPFVIESSSEITYHGDIELDKKPRLYGLIGVKEYFAYDPNTPRVWPKSYTSRLLGWRYDEKGIAHPIVPDERGWRWSEVLESWLAILTARHVLPVWERVQQEEDFTDYEVSPETILRVAEDVLMGRANLKAAYDDLCNNFNTPVEVWANYNIALAYRAAFLALEFILANDFAYFENVYADDVDQVERYSVDFNMLAMQAYTYKSGSMFGEAVEFDTQKRLEFWEWWLNKAIPQAWELAHDNQKK